MPKDNEVDEKVRPVAWIVTNGGESCEPWLEYEQSEVDALPAVCIAEPLYSAATVAELRAEVERLQFQLGLEQVRVYERDQKIAMLADKADAAERRVVELEAAAKGAMALAWTDTREVEFDPTVILSPDQYDFSGWDCMRMEIHTPSGAWAVWPSGGKFSLYGGPNGLMCFERFSTREEAEERAYREIDRYCPTYPTAIVRKAITGADPT